jgi:hypothetical protein
MPVEAKIPKAPTSFYCTAYGMRQYKLRLAADNSTGRILNSLRMPKALEYGIGSKQRNCTSVSPHGLRQGRRLRASRDIIIYSYRKGEGRF